jgi:hypothetical protein
LKALNHVNLNKIKKCEVRNELMQIVYDYQEDNLKEYFKKNSLIMPPSAFSQMHGVGKHCMTLPLEKIKCVML